MVKFLLLTIFVLLISGSGRAQSCTDQITGTSCTGNTLSANFNGGPLSKLIWSQNGVPVYVSDTVSSPASITIVAGNHGTGSGNNQFGFPAGGIALDNAGNIYVADIKNNRIQKWTPGSDVGITVAGGHGAGAAANQLSQPQDVFVDALGNIYIADAENSRIQKWAPGSSVGVTVAGGNGYGSAANQLTTPAGVYVDAAGNIYIADVYNYRVQKWRHGANSGITVAGGNGYGNGANQFTYAKDVVVDASGNVYVADVNTENGDEHRIQKWAPGALNGVTIAGGAGSNQFGYLLAISIDANNNIYAADNGISGTPVSRILKFAPGSNKGIVVAGGHSDGRDQLQFPTGVAIDQNFNIFVLDGVYNQRVQKYIPTNGIVNTTFIPTQAGKYKAEAYLKNGCIANSNTKNIFSIPARPDIKPVKQKGRGDLCGGGIDTFYVVPTEQLTQYTWTLPVKSTLISDNGDSIIIAVSPDFSKGKLIINAANFCGTAEADTLQLRSIPVRPNPITGPSRVYANQQNIQYSVEDDGLLYHWDITVGTIISGQNTAEIFVNWGAAAGLISVTASNDCGTSTAKEKTISLKNGPGNFAGQFSFENDDLKTNETILLSPNPAKNTVHLLFNATKSSTYILKIVNAEGKVVMQKNIPAIMGKNATELNIAALAPGIYFINLTGNFDTKKSVRLLKE